MKPRLILRADGDARIGLGHVMRLVAVAELLGAEFDYTFAIQEPSAAVSQLLTGAGLLVQVLPTQPIQAEAAWLVANLLKPGDVIVLDGYSFDYSYQQTLRAARIRLVAIDDLRTWPAVADVLINHSPGVTSAMYEGGLQTTFLLGPAYSLVRRAFVEACCPPIPPAPITTVLVSFGGADPLGLTTKCLAALLALDGLTHIGLLTGSAFAGDLTLLKQQATTFGKAVVLHQRLNATELVQTLRAYDAIICPASTILIESLLLGRPVLTGYFVENQLHLATFVQQHGQAHSVGDFTQLGDAGWLAALTSGREWLTSTPRNSYTTTLHHQELRTVVRRLFPD